MRLYRKITLLLLAALFSLQLAVPAVAAETAASIRLTKTEGTVAVTNAAARTMSIRENMLLYSGYHVNTRDKSYAWLQLDDDRLAKLDASSEAELRKSGGKLELLLASGSISFNVSEPLKEDETLNIRTSTMAMGIRGTCGWVQVVDQVTTRVYILEGTVACTVTDPLSGQQKTVVLDAGQSATLVVCPEEETAVRCEIDQMPVTEEDVPGYFLVELAGDEDLCELIFDASRIDLRNITEEDAQEKQDQDQDTWDQVLQEVRRAEDDQEHSTSQDPVWEEESTPAAPSGGGTSAPITYTLTFDPNGGTLTGAETASASAGATYDLSQVEAPTHSDKDFAGWATSPTAMSSDVISSVKLTEDTTLYAVWYKVVDAATTADALTKLLKDVKDVKVVADSSGAPLTIDSNSDLAVPADSLLTVDSEVQVVNFGTITVASGGTMTVKDALTNDESSAITVNGTLNVTGTTNNSGTINVYSSNSFHADGKITNNEGGLLKAGVPTDPIEPADCGFIEAKGGIDNQGGLVVETGCTLTVAAEQLTNDGYFVNGTTLEIGSGMAEVTNFLAEAKNITDKANITEIILAEGVRAIGEQAFEDFTGLTSVTIPSTVTSIGASAFSGCESLASVSIPSGVTSIGARAFTGCAALESVTFAEGSKLTTIGNYAFYNSGLTGNLVLPDSVTSVGSYAFGSTALTTASVPVSVTSLDGFAFGQYNNTSGATNIKIYYQGTSEQWGNVESPNNDTDSTVNTCVYIRENVTDTGTTWYNMNSSTGTLTISGTGPMKDYVTLSGTQPWKDNSVYSVVIEDGVTNVGPGAFSVCADLTSVTIAASVKTIGAYAFSGCETLKSVAIPDNVTAIGDKAFYGCAGLADITIPDSVTSIGSDAFSGCSGAADIVIGNGVTSIGNQAFLGCSSLANLTIGSSVANVGTDAFSGCATDNLKTITYLGTLAQWNSLPADSLTALRVFNGCTVSAPNANTGPLSYAYFVQSDGTLGKTPIS